MECSNGGIGSALPKSAGFDSTFAKIATPPPNWRHWSWTCERAREKGLVINVPQSPRQHWEQQPQRIMLAWHGRPTACAGRYGRNKVYLRAAGEGVSHRDVARERYNETRTHRSRSPLPHSNLAFYVSVWSGRLRRCELDDGWEQPAPARHGGREEQGG
jgi:hypothetical protein